MKRITTTIRGRKPAIAGLLLSLTTLVGFILTSGAGQHIN